MSMTRCARPGCGHTEADHDHLGVCDIGGCRCMQFQEPPEHDEEDVPPIIDGEDDALYELDEDELEELDFDEEERL